MQFPSLVRYPRHGLGRFLHVPPAPHRCEHGTSCFRLRTRRMCELCDLRRECLRHFGTLLDLARVSLCEVSDGLVRMRFKRK